MKFFVLALLFGLLAPLRSHAAKPSEVQTEFCLPDILDMARPAIRAMQADFRPYTVNELSQLIRYPSVENNDKAIGDTMAHIARLMKAIAPGIGAVKTFKVTLPSGKKSKPYVFGHWVQDPKLPTVLLYAHGDVQPADASQWRTPPFEPTIRRGRLYGRGATDNKSGIVILLSAMKALASVGKLPVNVKFIVEAEEESGSAGMKILAKEHLEKLTADTILVADAGSAYKGVPGLITSLRGGLILKLKLAALRTGLHSGINGGVAPNPFLGLIQLIAKLTNEQQELVIPGILDGVPRPSEEEQRRLASLNIPPEAIERSAGLLPGVRRSGDLSLHPLFSIGRGVATIASNVVPSEDSLYTIPASASATLGFRLPPGLPATRAYQLIEKYLQANRPLGMQLTVELDYAGDGWYQEVDAPAFNEVSSILEHVYGREVQFINSGGGLPLVSLLASVNKPKTPVVLYGAYDPESHIHGHNESVSIETLRQNVKATIYFLSAMGNH